MIYLSIYLHTHKCVYLFRGNCTGLLTVCIHVAMRFDTQYKD